MPVGFLLILLANMRRTGSCELIVSDTNFPLPRCHNGDAGVPNHRIDFSLQRLFRRRSNILFLYNMDAKMTVRINQSAVKKQKNMPHVAHMIWLISSMEAVMNLYIINVGNALHYNGFSSLRMPICLLILPFSGFTENNHTLYGFFPLWIRR